MRRFVWLLSTGPPIADLAAGECVVTKPQPKTEDIVVMSKFGVQVFDQTGHSLEGVDVSVHDAKQPANQHVRVAKTDANGYVLPPSLAAGDYSLEIYVPGFSPVRLQMRVATNDPSAVDVVATRLYVSGECPTPSEACGVKGKARSLGAPPACLLRGRDRTSDRRLILKLPSRIAEDGRNSTGEYGRSGRNLHSFQGALKPAGFGLRHPTSPQNTAASTSR
jgi:carboxypeptidase family protein